MKVKDFLVKHNLQNTYSQEVLDFDILLLVRAGSHAYGTATETSDEDFRGIFIIPNDYLYGLRNNYIPQLTFGEIDKVKGVKADNVFYEIGRFMELLSSSNPNILELIHIDGNNLIYNDSVLTELINNRNKFITKQCKNSVGGYAIAQINKASGQQKFQNWDANKTTRKTPLDFITVYLPDKTKMPIKQWLIDNKINQRQCGLVQIPHTYDKLVDFMTYHAKSNSDWYSLSFHMSKLLQSLSKYGVIDLGNTQNAVNNKLYHIESILTTIKGNKNNISYKHVTDLSNAYKQVLQPFYKVNKITDKYKYLMTYALFVGNDENYKGIVKEYGDGTLASNELRLSSISKTAKMDVIVSYDMNGYSTHCKDYKNYQTWLLEKNEQRWVDNKSHNQKLDGKNLSHCVRLLTMSEEIANNKGLIVHRPDREYLLSIRRGEVDLTSIIDNSKKQIKKNR